MMERSVVGWLIFLILGTTACYEPIESCLDTTATNYTVDADRPCSACCEYPTLSLNVRHRWVYPDTTVNFRLDDSVYLDNNGQAFKLDDLRFYLSNFRFVLADGSEVGVTDMVELQLNQEDGSVGEEEISDNFAIVTPASVQNYSIGTFQNPGDFTAVKFLVGLDDLANSAVPGSLPDDHPLSFQPTDLYWSVDSGYVFYEIAILRDTTVADTIPTVLEIGTAPYRQEVTLPVAGTIPEGFDLVVTLQVNYERWFGSLDNIRSDSESDLIETIVSNLAESFSVVDISID